MEKATEKNLIQNEQDTAVEQPKEKLYEFRKLTSVDVFPMFTIISKIGINEFTACFNNGGLQQMIAAAKGDANAKKDVASLVGISVVLEAVNVILGNLPKCEKEIYSMLAHTSNLDVDALKAMSIADFAEMVIDFVQKEEFADFIKVVSKLFK
jgi:hypothetical protein